MLSSQHERALFVQHPMWGQGRASMRATLITLMLAMASAVAAAQGGSWFDDLTDFWGYAPIEEVREREAAVEEREAAVEKHAARLRTREMAVGRREAAISQREKDAILAILKWVVAGVILGGVLVWWLQHSKVGCLKQRCRKTEQSLASMRDERDQAQTQLRKTAADLTKAQQKHASIRKARDEAEAQCRQAESTIHRLRDDLECFVGGDHIVRQAGALIDRLQSRPWNRDADAARERSCRRSLRGSADRSGRAPGAGAPHRRVRSQSDQDEAGRMSNHPPALPRGPSTPRSHTGLRDLLRPELSLIPNTISSES